MQKVNPFQARNLTELFQLESCKIVDLKKQKKKKPGLYNKILKKDI